MPYTYHIDEVEVTAPRKAAPADLVLHASLGLAAVLAFEHAKPVTVKYQGNPYRVVSVTVPPKR